MRAGKAGAGISSPSCRFYSALRILCWYFLRLATELASSSQGHSSRKIVLRGLISIFSNTSIKSLRTSAGVIQFLSAGLKSRPKQQAPVLGRLATNLRHLTIMTKLNNHPLYNQYQMAGINNGNMVFKKKNLFEEEENNKGADQNAKLLKQAKKQPQVQDKGIIMNGAIIQEAEGMEIKQFSSFDLDQKLVGVLRQLGFVTPTKIQHQALTHSLQPGSGDMLCLSETGSGKTLSFLLPIINSLSKQEQVPHPGYALVLAPTRELCLQIQDYLVRFKEQGLAYCTSVVVHGGADTKMKQVLELVKKPNIVVGTPGRILDHLENTKGFHLKNMKYLVLDEADKLLNLDFEKQINEIIKLIPDQRIAYLYSATLTSKVEKLQRVSLKNPIRIEVNSKYKTVSKLEENYIFIPSKWKDCYLVYLLKRFKEDRVIVFGKTCLGVERLFLVLRELKFSVECLHGDLSQAQRVKSLENFRERKCRVLVCTDVAARGIDISDISLVVNYDLCCPKDYIHRVGRTARIGKEGKAVSIVTQYDVEAFQEIEKKLGKKIEELATEETEALVFLELLDRCHQEVSRKMRASKTGKSA